MTTEHDSVSPESPADVEEDSGPDITALSENVFIFRTKTFGVHENVYEGEIRSSIHEPRPCVIKFALVKKQISKEVAVLKELDSHNNVVTLIESGTYCDVFRDRDYIVLDKYHNENLRQYLTNRNTARNEFDRNQAIDFAKQIIAGIMHIHSKNIIHLDLKPSNILISQNLQVIKIADFGLSIIVKSPNSKVFHKHQFGTFGYRPVESFGNSDVSMRTDIFSAGTVLFYLLSNCKDVFGRDEHEFTSNVMNDVTNFSGLLVANPVTTEHLIKHMVSKERRRRPNIWEVFDHPCWNGEEVECDLEYYCDDEAYDENNQMEVAEIESDEPPVNADKQREFMQRLEQMGFNRKPQIILLDDRSKHLHAFDPERISLTKMHEYQFSGYVSATASVGEYVFIFDRDRSVHRLEYCDNLAKWEKMTDWIGDHGSVPDVIASSTSIYLICGWVADTPTKSASKYHPLTDHWEKLPDKRAPTRASALACDNEYVYCIGGINKYRQKTSRVERMNIETNEWFRVKNMNHAGYEDSAVACRGKVYAILETAIEGSLTTIIDVYSPDVDQWTIVKSIQVEHTDWIFRTFAIGGNLFSVKRDKILKYDVSENELSEFMTYKDKYFGDAAVISMSTK